MSALKRKLNEKDGVSVLIALVGFLVAAMVSVVVISAALTSAKRVADDRSTNQSLLALESAAQLVRDGVEDTSVTYTVANGTTTLSATGEFADEMKKAVQYVDTHSTLEFVSKNNSADFSIELSDSSIKTVNVTFIMKNNTSEANEKYDVYFTLSIVDDNGETQEMYLQMNGDPDSYDQDITRTIYWVDVGISQVGGQNANTN